MRTSKTLAKWRSGRPVRVCGLGHFIPHFIRHAAGAGYDCIWLDLEHRTMGMREVQALLAYFHLFDIDCLLRPPTLEKTGLYRYLEEGASGLMIPFVCTADKARDVVAATKFPPLGNRGIDAAGIDADYTHQGPDEYVQQANEQTFVVAQIETPEAVQNVDEIAAVEGVDAIFVGAADLGMRIKRSNTSFTMEEAFKRVAAAAQRHGKQWGTPSGSPQRTRELFDMGAGLICHGSEFLALMQMLEDSSREMDTIYGDG
ncbi:MAG: aldolase/citrate lyase family protein [Phycisphaeraceae bacterium]|nr:aldolase/citrate lyase family protein [Phycisphaeraceae bacterium]